MTSFYGNRCSRYITVRKALAHVLNELRDFRVVRSEYKTIDIKEHVDHIYICRSCFDHFESDRDEVVSERDAFTDTETSLIVYGPITRQSECVCVCDDLSLSLSLSLSIYIYIYVCVCVCACVCVCVCVCVYVQYVYACMYGCSLYVGVCVYKRVCVCLSVCCLLNAISVIHTIIYR